MPYLEFIDDDKLLKLVREVLEVKTEKRTLEINFFKSLIDPFSAVFECAIRKIEMEEWMNFELNRQLQKSLQNKVGLFHEKILSELPKWEKAPNLIDLVNKKERIIAEVKNKHNTLNSDGRLQTYSKLLKEIEERDGSYFGFTAFYVPIIPPKNNKRYTKAFSPSDPKTGKKLFNEKILEIDGFSFYDMATGKKNSLKSLYEVLPEIIRSVIKKSDFEIEKSDLFQELFERTFIP